MSSKKEEIAHVSALRQLLTDSGVECTKTVPESSESSILSGEFEIKEHFEEHLETAIEETVVEEEKPVTEEDTEEELPEIFPSRSLRRMLPERIRQIEEQNTIHVLPEVFNKDIDPNAIPKIAGTAPRQYIDMLAKMTGCESYMTSLAEFWFLDTLANLLRRAQEDKLDRSTQAILILWFCEWMKEIQHFDAADRQRMLKRFQDNMLSAARFVGEENHLPTPAEAGVFYTPPQDDHTHLTPLPSVPTSSKRLVTFDRNAYECSLKDLTQIIHYIYDLFSTDYQYDLVRSVFTFPPGYTLIDAPNQLQKPKTLYQPSKVKAKKPKSPKKDMKGSKKKEVETEEYLALLELITKAEREQEEMEEREREEWNRRSHILPLNSATAELWQRYWPPLPPVPDPEPQPKPKAKGKKH